MPSGSPRLFLIDGYALIYRAFFAMISRPLRTSRGENTSVAWGVATFLHRLFERHDPTFVAWVHDAGSSFRTETYPDYKATREKLDEELQDEFDRSVERIEQLLKAFNVPLVTVAGYEADDVIGTLASEAAERAVEVVIVSGDKDFYQLISSNIVVLDPGRGGPAPVDERLVNRANAAERMGIPPERVVDYLALVGDSSDNVPGVRGIGDKTARALIAAYGDLDSILAHAGEVKGKRAREGLEQYADDARLSRELVTIKQDVPVQLNLEALRARAPDKPGLLRLYADLEFHSLTQQLGADEAQVLATAPQVVVDVQQAEAVAHALRRHGQVVVDARTRSTLSRRPELVGLSLAVPAGQSWYLPFGHRTPQAELSAEPPPRNLPTLGDEQLKLVAAVLEDPAVAKVGHDVKQACLALRTSGVEMTGVVFDSMLASFVLDPGRRSHELEVLAQEHLHLQLRGNADVVGKGKAERPVSEVPVEDASTWSAERAAAILQLRVRLDGQLDKMEVRELYERIELPLVKVLVDMEWRGIAIDRERLLELSQQFSDELVGYEQQLFREAGTDFNINSTPQLRHILFEKLQLPVLKRTKTGPSTDADVLSQLASMGYELPKLLLNYRELSKLKSTYVDVLPESVNAESGRIHTSFNQTGAATGRLSSSNPNLQNIPVRTPRGELIRQCFVPAPGCRFIVADYSQIELRVLAHLSQDEAFIRAFRRGGDIHVETAAIIFDTPVEDVTPDMRARAKTINFATIYGQGPFALARQLGITQEEAKDFIRLYFTRFAGVREFLDATVEQARTQGFVETLFGRRRYIPELRDPNYNVRAFGERTAMNSPMQGSAADLIKVAMINLSAALRREGLETAILLQVHDELVLESPDREVEQACGIVVEEMQTAGRLRVPLVVDVGVGANWLHAKE